MGIRPFCSANYIDEIPLLLYAKETLKYSFPAPNSYLNLLNSNYILNIMLMFKNKP